MSVTTERTVRELVLEHPALTRVLEKLGIDYCCGGRRSLRDACLSADIPVERALALLDGATRAKAQAGPGAAVVLHNLVEGGFDGSAPASLPPFLAELLERYRELYRGYSPADARYLTLHRGHLMFLRPEEAPLITAELIREMTFTATPDVLVERIRALKAAGYTQVAIQIGPGQEDAIDDWAKVFERI